MNTRMVAQTRSDSELAEAGRYTRADIAYLQRSDCHYTCPCRKLRRGQRQKEHKVLFHVSQPRVDWEQHEIPPLQEQESLGESIEWTLNNLHLLMRVTRQTQEEFFGFDMMEEY